MDDKARDFDVEDTLARFGVHFHIDDTVPLDQIAQDANPARWKERYDELHKTEIACAILDQRPMPAFLLYRPAGATWFRMLGGRHRFEALIDLKYPTWPAYVIDEPLEEFLIEALPIFDNVGKGKEYTKSERLEFAAHLLTFKDRDEAKIAQRLQLKVADIRQFVDLQAAMIHAQDQGIAHELKRLPVNLQIDAHKAFPTDDVRFKAVVQTLAFTEVTGHAAKGLIKDALTARSETAALARLAEIYEKHRLELERRKRGGRKPTPTLAQRYRRANVILENSWPGRVEVLEITSFDDEFVCDLEARVTGNIAHMIEVQERCREVKAMREKYRKEQKEAA